MDQLRNSDLLDELCKSNELNEFGELDEFNELFEWHKLVKLDINVLFFAGSYFLAFL